MQQLTAFLATILLLSSTSQARRLQAIFFESPDNSPKPVYVHMAESKVEMEVSKANFSKPVELPDTAQVIRVSFKDNLPVDAPKSDFVTARLAESKNDLLMVLVRTKEAPGFGVELISLDSKFGLGDSLWVNRSPSLIGGKFEDKRLVVRPGKTAIQKSPVRGDRQYSVDIFYKDPKTKKQARLRQTRWRNLIDARQLCFVTQQPDDDLPKVTVFTLAALPERKQSN